VSRTIEHIIDRIRGRIPGPTLVVVGGVHGNEPAGVEAARAVFARLRADGVEVRGEVVGLEGNVRGLAVNRRCLVTDLNRLWTREKLDAARRTASAEGEYAELVELASELDRIIAATRGPVVVLDLHTTSAAGIPFGVAGPTTAHRAFAHGFPIPSILGLEEMLEGVLTRYLSGRGILTLAVEGGQTGTADAVANLDAVITIALAVTGAVAPEQIAGLAAARARLETSRGALPQTIEVVIRHEVKPDHAFRMQPGFANIHATAGGTLLAHDRHGEIRAPFEGLVLLPLYQSEGSDGFFYGRAV
jgi:succinylglutamate desuccinylase